jgi:hypothetical protein
LRFRRADDGDGLRRKNRVERTAGAFGAKCRAQLRASHGGELAFIYLSGFSALLIAGGGMISLDMVVFGRNKKG